MGRAVLIANPTTSGRAIFAYGVSCEGNADGGYRDVPGLDHAALAGSFVCLSNLKRLPRYNRRGEQFCEQTVILDGLFPSKIGLTEGPIVIRKRQA